MADKIFINYRRDDSISTSGRLHDRLAQAFGRKNLFMDVDHIPAGVDFVEYLNSQVATCDVFLAIIGPNWLHAKDDDGRRRFENPDDFVTIEIAAALARNIRVIPVLVDGARTPKADKLPDSIKPLVRRNAVEVRNTHFGRDAEALVDKVREALQNARPVMGRRAAWLIVPSTWLIAAGSATALLLVGWIGFYQMGAPAWVTRMPTGEQAANAEARQARTTADAEARLKAAEAEQQRLKEEVQRQTKAAADAEEKRKAAEAEQQRLTAEAEARRKAEQAAAEAEARRKARQAEVIRAAESVGFSVTNQTAVRGEEYLILREVRAEACLNECQKDGRCKMFAYWNNQTCYLFDQNFNTYQNSAAQTGVRSSSRTFR
jgi:hypothetical protein